jgi:thiol:disulfide interchange protein
MFRIFLAIAIAITLCFGDIEWVDSLKKAKEQSHQTKKPIFILASVDGCPYCKMMREVILVDNELSQYIGNNFVPFLLYPAKAQYPKDAHIKGVPTILIYDENENKLSPNIEGLLTPKELLEKLKNIRIKIQ